MIENLNMFPLTQAFPNFWQQHPALLYGLAVLLGVSCALCWTPILILPIVVMALPLIFTMKRRLLLASALGLGVFLYTHSISVSPQLPLEGVYGTGHFTFSSVTSISTHFGKRWLFKGTLQKFVPDQDDAAFNARNIPCAISIPFDDELQRPPADAAYQIYGRLKQTSAGYTFVVLKDTPWHSIPYSWSLAEYRFWAKKAVATYIQKHISDQQAATFLSGTATGDFDDRFMGFAFSRFGLQHIMAISGFHFTIIAGILSFLFRIFLERRAAAYLLIFLMTSYFIFLGTTPSILRAWITTVIVLCGFLIDKHGSGLNSLGIALIALPLWDPFCIQNLGFQLSFIITAAILMFYPLCDNLMKNLFTQRRLFQMIEMNGINQHGYCLLVVFRQVFAMMLAVNSIALPMLLYIFHKFPLLSIIYNLFFPFLVSISMLFLLLGLLLAWIPPLASLFHLFNDIHTRFMLNLAYDFPVSYDVYWRISSLNFETLMVYITFLFALGIGFQYYADKEAIIHKSLII